MSDPMAQRWTGLFSDPNLQAQSKQASPSLYQTSLTVTSFTPPTASPCLRDLAQETNQARTQGFLSSTTWLNGILVTETELAQNQGGAGWLQNRIPGDTTGDASQRMIRLGLTGTAGSIRYGILSRSAGQAFLQVPDQTRREVWDEWTSGWTSLRSAIGQQWNNVIEDSTRPRLEQTYGKFGVAWKRPVWPEITLTYAHNSLNLSASRHICCRHRRYHWSLTRRSCLPLTFAPSVRSSAWFTRISVSDPSYQTRCTPGRLIYNQLKLKVIGLPLALELARPYRFLPTGKRNIRMRLVG